MDAAEELPQQVDPDKEPYVDVDSESLLHSPRSTATANAVSKVLGDDNLLREIILRVGFPTTLVRAALVCKRWLCHALDRRFLTHFRERHPPRLGFYLEDMEDHSVPARFFPMLSQPPELATIVLRASFSLDSYRSTVTGIMGCHNGGVLISLYEGKKNSVGVHSPLRPERGLAVLPPLPQLQIQDDYLCLWRYVLTFAEEAGDLSYLYVWVECNKETTKSTVHVHKLRHDDDVWRAHRTFDTYEHLDLRWETNVEFADNKVYIASALDDIVVFDLTASSISRIQLPQGVEYGHRDTRLARANDASGVYLIHAKKLQVCVWLHRGDSWLLLHNICLREMVADLRMTGCEAENVSTAPLRINHVGDYAKFVFLEMGRCALHLDIKYKKLCKVYVMEEKDRRLGDIHPFMMIWPPTFPTLKDDPASNAM